MERGLRKILTGNLMKQVSADAGKAQSEKRSLTGRQIGGMIYDFFKISADAEAILDFTEMYGKVHSRSSTFKPATQRGVECCQQSLTHPP